MLVCDKVWNIASNVATDETTAMAALLGPRTHTHTTSQYLTDG